MTNPLFDALFAPLPGRTGAVLETPDGTVFSGPDLAGQVERMAAALARLGIGPGDRVLVQVEKSPTALAVYGACLRAGAIFVPLNTAYTAPEMGYFIADAEPALVLCDPAAAAGLAESARTGGARLMTMDATGRGEFTDLAADLAADAPACPRGADDIAVILYTSGTTGRSKGAMLSHGNLLSNAAALCDLWRITSADVLLHTLPIFHAHGLFVAVNTSLLAGARMLFHPGFRLDDVIAALPRASTMMGVPTHYTRLLDDPRFSRDLAGHMRLFVSGSAPLLAETHDRFAARTGHRILERYGMTETSMNTSNPYDGERRAGTVGMPLPGVDLRITAEGVPLPRGETGMIEVRGPNVFKGYWRMPEKTAEDLRPDGWLITGDLGRIDGDGYLHIVGRAKDMIISGGYNVYPKEVELALDAAPWVRESAVFAAPHPDFGEAVVAIVVPERGAIPDVDGLRDRLAQILAPYKRPKRILLADSLPRNTMGKVQKNVLRADHAGLFDGQS